MSRIIKVVGLFIETGCSSIENVDTTFQSTEIKLYYDYGQGHLRAWNTNFITVLWI